MTDRTSPPTHRVRSGLRLSVASIVWTIVTSAVAEWIGITTHSLVLVAFGLVGLLDAAGSVGLVVHFRHALRHDALSSRHEETALRIITIGLYVVGAFSLAESAHRLATHGESTTGAAGIVLAALSALVLAVLALRKRHVAGHIPSDALRADASLSATGSALAVVTLVGTAATSAFGWRWIDPGAATVVGVAAIAMGVGHRRSAATEVAAG